MKNPAGRTVQLDGRDMGCETPEVQMERLAAVKAGDRDRYAALSARCKRLAGPFSVREARRTPDGQLLRVGFGDGSLWVLLSPLLAARDGTGSR